MEGYKMATFRTQSKLHWYLSLFILTLNVSSLFAADINPSKFSANNGGKFYLLSEETFGSQDQAKVRLEASPYLSTENGGVDIRLYRIPQPISFLEKQKNLHRPAVEGKYKGEGIRNALHYVWDVVYKKSRLVWQRLLSFEAREKAVKANPAFTQHAAHKYDTRFEHNPQFGFIPGLAVIQSFRYPIQFAKPIPPKNVNLAGSSSNFLNPNGKEGTVHVPFGKLAPGLYLVEGLLGTYRANCLLFVSDTVAVTKVSSDEHLSWTVHRENGKVSPNTVIQVTDGLGRLGKGKTDQKGVYVLKKKDMERTYVFGEDAQGGVFISENFYYDSEIYSHKLYVTTDRPLYRPGETVFFNGIGRNFKNSIQSSPLPPGEVQFKVIDPSGVTVWKKNMKMFDSGFSGSFSLPTEAISGGYELNYAVHGMQHTSYIRVANFVKPHFEVEVDFVDKQVIIGRPVTSLISLKYPNGKPVLNAEVDITVRKQTLAMEEGELTGMEMFPVELSAEEFTSDEKGQVELEIPAVDRASRLIVQVKASDSQSYRVNKSKEIVIASDLGFFGIESNKELSKVDEAVIFKLNIVNGNKEPVLTDYHWILTRLEDQTKYKGTIPSTNFSLKFPKPGNYILNIRNKEDIILATKTHWVEGEGIETTPGTITIVMDKESYLPGETANFIVNFSEDIEEAFITLERDKVEKWSLISRPESWLTVNQTGLRSLKGSLKVEDLYAPNMTFSVVYVRNGKFVFENKGLKVEVPKIEISYKFDKPRYAPGETVQVEVLTNYKGRGIASEMSVGVVDEMIYALQAEVAPSIFNFFYHFRRNQVKTSASLAFHSFDAAVSAINLDEPNSSYEQRNLKVMKDRARREEKDTAYWNPSLKTDALGKARFSFKMPDSITKWRITGRAFSGNWSVGQKTGALESYKDFYHTYVGPREFRKGDSPVIQFAVFNNTGKEEDIDLVLDSVGQKKIRVGQRPVYVNFDPSFKENVDLLSQIQNNGKMIDTLQTNIKVDTKAWTSDFVLEAGGKFPEDAQNIKAYPFSAQSEKVMNSLDALWEYPYGCVEQTASRLLPLSLAYNALEKGSANEAFLTQMQRRIYNARSRLIRMASENAKFTWWGDLTTGNLLMKVYAFYTDFHASKTLDIELPPGHWEGLLEDYQSLAEKESFSDKALILWMLKEIGLPVKSLVEGVLEKAPLEPTESYILAHSSLYMDHAADANQWATGMLLLDHLHKKDGKSSVPSEMVKKAEAQLKDTPFILSKAILALRDKIYLDQNLDLILSQTSDYEEPTFDRALALSLLWDSLKISPEVKVADLPAPWVKKANGLGYPFWLYSGKDLPAALDQKLFKYTFSSAKDQKSDLKVKIERKIFKLEKAQSSESNENEESEEDADLQSQFVLGEEVKDGILDSSELYVDKIKISSNEKYAFSLLEVPLISGMELETQTWGILLKDGDDEVVFGHAKPGPRENYYVVPVTSLESELTYYNLVRPGVDGKFVLPPVRFHRMYAPNLMAFEGESKLDFKKITVR